MVAQCSLRHCRPQSLNESVYQNGAGKNTSKYVVLQDCSQLDQAFGSCRENSTTAESSKAKASFVGLA
jgi:hypothetical protein